MVWRQKDSGSISGKKKRLSRPTLRPNRFSTPFAGGQGAFVQEYSGPHSKQLLTSI